LPHQLTTFLFALARFGAAPPLPWAGALLAALSSAVRRLSPVALSDVLWSLAELGLTPSQDLLERFEEAAAGKLLALSPPPRLVRAVATLVRLGRAPDGAALLLALDDDLRPAGLPGDALAELLWALGRMRFRPGGAWTDDAERRVLAAAPRPPPRRAAPAPLGVGDEVISGGSGGPGSSSGGDGSPMSPANWARALQGLAGIGACPGADWVLSAARATAALLPVMTGEQLLIASRALGALAPEAAAEVAGLLGLAPTAPPAPRKRQAAAHEGAASERSAAAPPPPGMHGGGAAAPLLQPLKRPVLPPKQAAR
jgi:hypothetical protein